MTPILRRSGTEAPPPEAETLSFWTFDGSGKFVQFFLNLERQKTTDICVVSPKGPSHHACKYAAEPECRKNEERFSCEPMQHFDVSVSKIVHIFQRGGRHNTLDTPLAPAVH